MAVVNIGQVVPTNIVQQVENGISDVQFSMDQSDVTVSTTQGTIAAFTVVIKFIGRSYLTLEYLDFKMSGLNENSRPTIYLTCNRLKDYGDFWQTLPSGARGGTSYSNCFPTDGGALTHTDGANRMQLVMNSYFVPLKSGYYHVTA